MTDHVYEMSALNQNIGYNQPTHTGYYLGSDYDNDEEIWASAGSASGVDEIASDRSLHEDGVIYDLMGRRVESPSSGIYIKNGKKFVVK